MRDHVADGRTSDAPTTSVVGLCSCGFATSNYEWMTCHLIEHPGHCAADPYGNWGPEPPP